MGVAFELVDYFDRELGYLRGAGIEFARRYPNLAQRLELQSGGSTDPHVERLIESFAFLTARIQRKIDDEFPEITEALLSVIQPHLLSPIPSLSILQFQADPSQGRNTEMTLIPKRTPVYSSKTYRGISCTFQTCYDTAIWPIAVCGAKISAPKPENRPPQRAQSALTLDLQCMQNIAFRELSLSSLRFYLHGGSRVTSSLYEFLLNQVSWIEIWDPADNNAPILSRPRTDIIKPVGFEAEEGLLPYTSRTQLGYRLLLEYFALPQKFLFVDFTALHEALPRLSGQQLRILCYSDQRYPSNAEAIEPSIFRLGCTPIVNLYARTAERITVKQTQHEYRIVPDMHRTRFTEVYSIERVRGFSRADTDERLYHPFYSISHSDRVAGRSRAYWYAVRRDIMAEGETLPEIYLSFTGLDFDLLKPMSEVLVIDTLCSNRDLPSQLPFGESSNDFVVEGFPIRTTWCLVKPTPVRRLSRGHGMQWRLISHMSLNYAALSDPEHGREALLEILRLYDFHEADVTEQQIAGISDLTCQPCASRVTSANGESALARGFDISLEFDPQAYVGSSVFLFASVLERFLGLYVSMNSFTRLTARLKGKEGMIHRWRARAGSQLLL